MLFLVFLPLMFEAISLLKKIDSRDHRVDLCLFFLSLCVPQQYELVLIMYYSEWSFHKFILSLFSRR